MADAHARRELAGVEFPQSTWMSFDRYDRYGAIVRTLRANLGDGHFRVLDVGDAAGHLHLFDPDLAVIGIDLYPADQRLEGAVPVHGDGTCLPFADDTFDAVTSSDVLEHIPPEQRTLFLAELRRVSRDLVIVGAPFDTDGVGGVEELVRRFALLSLGAKQPQLEEHSDNGLPDLDVSVASFADAGWNVATAGNGNLWDWLMSMLLRFQVEARPALSPLVGGFDVFYNTSLVNREGVAPWYRHIVAARSSSRVEMPPRTVGDDHGESTQLSLALLTGCIAASSAEVVRQDTAFHLDADVNRRLDELSRQLIIKEATLDQVVAQNRDLRERFEELYAVQMRANRPSLVLQSLLGRVKRFARL